MHTSKTETEMLARNMVIPSLLRHFAKQHRRLWAVKEGNQRHVNDRALKYLVDVDGDANLVTHVQRSCEKGTIALGSRETDES